jgi:hypothetical protein
VPALSPSWTLNWVFAGPGPQPCSCWRCRVPPTSTRARSWGLPEVPDIPAAMRQDPIFHRSAGAHVGRDGCRVPLPWVSRGSSFGFGAGPAHLPPPPWFGRYAVDTQQSDPGSTLQLYWTALRLRRRLQGAEQLTWAANDNDSVVDFIRPAGWRSVTNFGPSPIKLPAGRIVISSAPIEDATLPSDTTAWICYRDRPAYHVGAGRNDHADDGVPPPQEPDQ